MSLAAGLAGLGGLAIGTGTYVVSAATLLRLRRRQRGNRETHYSPSHTKLKPLRGLEEGLDEYL